MKFVFHQPGGRPDIAPLEARFPGHDMVATRELDALAREIVEAEVLVTSNRPYLPEMVRAINDNQKRLKWIQFTTSGIDKALRSGGFPKGVAVTNCAGLGAPVLAEHALYLFLCVARRIRETEAAAARRDWIRDQISPSMVALAGRTLCVIGMGATGQQAAKRAKAFDMTVIGVSRAYRPDGLVDEVFSRERVTDALARADFVLLSMPAVAETRHFINDATLGAMKKTAILANVARGDLIDEDALVRALEAGAIAGAGLDVTMTEPTPPDSPLWDAPNLILTPHIGGTGADNAQRLIAMLGDNIDNYLSGRPLARVLDWPNMMPV